MLDKRSFDDWYLESARVTAFHFEEGTLSPQEWWEHAVNEEPDQVTTKPKERLANIAGSFGTGTLSIECKPLRIDLKLTPRNQEWDEPVGWPNLGPAKDVSDGFAEVANKLVSVKGLPPLNRIAYGCTLLLPVASKSEGYRQLAPYLPSVTLDPDKSSDFIYRINRRRDSSVAVPGLFMNRLNSWSVATFRPIVGTPPNLQPIEPRFACRLELDINTCQEFEGALPEKKIQDMLKELMEMGKEIVARGDVV